MSGNRLTIFDTTLRDGEQAPGFSLRIDEKLALARQLRTLGVDIIEAGFPIASDADAAAVRAIATHVDGPVIAALARCHAKDIERAANGGGARQVEGTVNGIGERAGNASLEEIVMAIRVRGDRLPYVNNIQSQEIYASSQLLTALTGEAVQANKAIVGRNAFAHEAGIHQ